MRMMKPFEYARRPEPDFDEFLRGKVADLLAGYTVTLKDRLGNMKFATRGDLFEDGHVLLTADDMRACIDNPESFGVAIYERVKIAAELFINDNAERVARGDSHDHLD